MTNGTSGKLRAWIVAVGIAAAAAAGTLTVLSIVVTARLETAAAAARMGIWAGAEVTYEGDMALQLFPAPTLSISGVRVTQQTAAGSPQAALTQVTVPKLHATLRVLPLLLGRLEVATLYLDTPRLHLPAFQEDFFESVDLHPAAPEMIVVHGGTVVRGAAREVIRGVNLEIRRNRTADTLAVTGSVDWRDQTVSVDAAVERPEALYSEAGTVGRLTLTMAADPAARTHTNDGSPARPASNWARTLTQELGRDGMPRIGPIQLGGTFRLASGPDGALASLAVLDGRLGFADSEAQGSLTLSRQGYGWHIDGALDVDQLDLGHHLGRWLPDSVAELLAMPVSSRWLRRLDGNLRLTAETIDCGVTRLTDAVVDLSARHGRVRMSLAEAGLAGGNVRGVLTLEPAGPGLAVQLAGDARDVSLAEAAAGLRPGRTAALLGAEQPPRGVGMASVRGLTRGATMGDLWRSLTGRAVVDIRDGSIDGADTVNTLERVADGESDIAQGHAPFIPSAGRTHFSRLTARLVADRGAARAEHVHLVGERFEIMLSGEVELAGGELTGEGTASLFQGGDDEPARVLVELPFGVGGTMSEPMGAPGIPRLQEEARPPDMRRVRCCREDPHVG